MCKSPVHDDEFKGEDSGKKRGNLGKEANKKQNSETNFNEAEIPYKKPTVRKKWERKDGGKCISIVEVSAAKTKEYEANTDT